MRIIEAARLVAQDHRIARLGPGRLTGVHNERHFCDYDFTDN
ncbi:hypothetical protein [Amycolatopsis sp. NPDC051903]